MSRDPRRIKPILKQLEALWTGSPDLRLGQLILNAAKVEDLWRYSDPGGAQFSNIYNVEDEELIKRISEYLKKE